MPDDGFLRRHIPRIRRQRFIEGDRREFVDLYQTLLREARISTRVLADDIGADPTTCWRWYRGEHVPDVKNEVALIRRFPEHEEDLKRTIELARESAAYGRTASYDIFLASPIAAAGDDLELVNAYVRPLFEATKEAGYSVYWAAETITGHDQVDIPSKARLYSADALIGSRYLTYAHPLGLSRPSSALVELGLALARRMPVTVVCDNERELPALFQGNAFHEMMHLRELASIQVVTAETYLRHIAKQEFLVVI